MKLTEPDLPSLVRNLYGYKTMMTRKIATINGFLTFWFKIIVDLDLKIS